jgi:hypothetical protein
MFQVGDRVIYTGEHEMLSKNILGRHGIVTKLYNVKDVTIPSDGHIIEVVFDDYNYRYNNGSHTVYIGNIKRATPDWEV